MSICIDEIAIHRVARPLRYPWRTAYGEDPAIEGILVKVRSGPHSGWGEAAPLRAPTYSPETAGTCFHVARDFLAPTIIGKTLDDPRQVTSVFEIFRGNPFAKSALESAIWALFSNATSRPLSMMMGGDAEPVQAGADFGVQDDIDMLLEKVSSACEAGYPRIKLKIRAGWDREVVHAVCTTFPDQVFHVDCNGGYGRDEYDLMRKLDTYGLAMIEQPFGVRDFLEHARLQARLETPVCLDESITCIADLEHALELEACRMLNVKIGRVGGIATAIELHDKARDAGIPCWVGSMLESGVGMSALISLATLPNFTYPGDLFPTREHNDSDITSDLEFDGNCQFKPPEAGALPFPDPLKLEQVTVDCANFKKTGG